MYCLYLSAAGVMCLEGDVTSCSSTVSASGPVVVVLGRSAVMLIDSVLLLVVVVFVVVPLSSAAYKSLIRGRRLSRADYTK